MKHIESNTLWLFMAGELSSVKDAQIHKHLSICKSCKAEYDMLNKIEETLNVIDEEIPSKDFADNIIQKLEREISLDSKGIFWSKILMTTIAGSLLLAFLFIFIGSTEVDVDTFQIENIFNSQTVLLIFACSIVLWGLYLIDRICKKMFVPLDVAKQL